MMNDLREKKNGLYSFACAVGIMALVLNNNYDVEMSFGYRYFCAIRPGYEIFLKPPL